MGSNRFMVVSEKDGIIAMNPSYVEQKGKSLIIYMPGTYKQLELEYETEENARIAFDSAAASARTKVYRKSKYPY